MRTMGKLLEYEYFIQVLKKTKSSRQRKCMLKYATKGQILALGEIVANYLEGNIVMHNSEHFSVFMKYKKYFRVLGYKGRRSWLKRREAAIHLGKVLVRFLIDIGNKIFH